jgi:hypothetical protein
VSINSLFAYIDPGSGLLIWQVVMAVCVGVLFYLRKVRKFFGKLGRKILGRAEQPEVNPTSEQR